LRRCSRLPIAERLCHKAGINAETIQGPVAMNKIVPTFIAVSLIAGSAFVGGYAQAQTCTSSPSNALQSASAINTLVSGKYVCAQFNGERWDELHIASGPAGGQLQDYKLGPNDPKDPSTIVGNYQIQTHSDGRDPEIWYIYGAASYHYRVFRDTGGNVSFCGVSGTAPQLVVTISAAHCY
jgi:hypothetical protein